MITISRIEWDLDKEDIECGVNLPNSVRIPDNVDDDKIADYLSDEYGYCVKSYSKK